MADYRQFAEGLALQAGKIIKENFLKGVKRAWKEDETPITVVDKEVNSLVLNSIKGKYPDHAVLAEEESDLHESDYVWVCDPIDGTIPFSHGLPISVFSLALTYKGESILGVIYDPYLDRLVVAEKGKGAMLNGKPIAVSETSKIKNTVIDVETWRTSAYQFAPLVKVLIDEGSQVSTFRSAVYSGMLVGMGELAAVVFAGKTAWDGAAVKIIVEEAGGKVTDLFGNEQSYNGDIKGFIASNGKIHDQLLQLLQPIISDR